MDLRSLCGPVSRAKGKAALVRDCTLGYIGRTVHPVRRGFGRWTTLEAWSSFGRIRNFLESEAASRLRSPESAAATAFGRFSRKSRDACRLRGGSPLGGRVSLFLNLNPSHWKCRKDAQRRRRIHDLDLLE